MWTDCWHSAPSIMMQLEINTPRSQELQFYHLPFGKRGSMIIGEVEGQCRVPSRWRIESWSATESAMDYHSPILELYVRETSDFDFRRYSRDCSFVTH